MSEERSVIHNVARAKQIMSFEGMIRHRNISPTDIDGVYDYNGKSFIYIEGKVITKDMPVGQKMALEHIVESHTQAGHPSIAILFTHNVPANEPVAMKNQYVKEIYFRKEWTKPQTPITVLDAVKIWEDYVRDKMRIGI